MNWDSVEGKWNEMSGAVKSKWAKLTDDDLKLVDGKLDQLVGRLQQRYGHSRDEAERQVNEFVKNVPTQAQTKPKA